MHLQLRLHAREVLLLGLCSLICCRIFMAHGRTGPLHRAGQSVRLVAFLSVSIPSKSFAFLANPVPAPAASAVCQQVGSNPWVPHAKPRSPARLWWGLGSWPGAQKPSPWLSSDVMGMGSLWGRAVGAVSVDTRLAEHAQNFVDYLCMMEKRRGQKRTMKGLWSRQGS